MNSATIPTDVSNDEAILKAFSYHLGKDITHYAPAFLIPALLNMVGIFLFTRIFPPDQYGDYLLAFVAVNFLSILLADWVVHSLLRFIPKFSQDEQRRLLYKNVAGILAVETFFSLFLALFFILFFHRWLGRFSSFFFLGLMLLYATMAFKLLSSVFQAQLMSFQFAKYQVFFAASRLAFSIALVFLVSRQVSWLILGTFLGYAVMVWPMMKQARLTEQLRENLRPDFSLVKRLSRYGIPLLGWILGAEVLMILDKFMLAVMRNTTEVGIYGANYSLTVSGISFVSYPIIMAAHPILITAWERHDQRQVQRLISSFSRYYVLFVLPCFAFTLAFSREIAWILLGPSFREGSAIIPLIFCGYLGWNFGMYGHKSLELTEKTKIMFYLILLCTLLNVVLNLILIPWKGYFGTAIASSVSMGLYPVIVYVVSDRIMKFRWHIPWLSLAKLGFSALMMFLLMLVLKREMKEIEPAVVLVLCGICGTALYFLLALLTKEIKTYERQWIKRAVLRKN